MTIAHKEVARILQNWNMGRETISDIDHKGTGNKNAWYVGEQYVLKSTCSFDKLKKHIEVAKALQGVGLASAVPIPAADGAEYVLDGEGYYFLTRRLQGEPMSAHRLAEGSGRFVGKIIGQLHLALAKINDCVNEADLLATVKDWALPKARLAMNLPDAFCESYLNTLAELYPKLPRQIIHRDPNPGNIIRSSDQWGFIDFELAERNIRIFDPCYSASAVLSESFGDDNRQWLEIYREIIL